MYVFYNDDMACYAYLKYGGTREYWKFKLIKRFVGGPHMLAIILLSFINI
jgi:hypothetical protein